MTDEKEVPVELGRLVLEGLDANPYEVVIAVSKLAREMNTKAQKFLGPEVEIKPVNLAMTELVDPETVFQYTESGDGATAAESPAGENGSL
jgi:DNA-directed RNA polymerase subunit K/omega